MPPGDLREVEAERDASQQARLAEERAQGVLVEPDRRRAGAARPAPQAHVEREHATVAAGDAQHLPRRRGPRRVVDDRGEARELRDEVERAVLERKLGGAADVPLLARVPLARGLDAAREQVDPVALAAPYSDRRWRK